MLRSTPTTGRSAAICVAAGSPASAPSS